MEPTTKLWSATFDGAAVDDNRNEKKKKTNNKIGEIITIHNS